MSRVRGRPKGGYIPDTDRKPALQRIKERHRLLAKFVAAGLTRNEIAARLDMTPERVGQLTLDPAMQNLIAELRDHPQVLEMTGMDEIALLRSISVQNALRAAAAMRDKLDYFDDTEEGMPVVSAAKIFELSADRIGFGKHSTNINVNVDFAAQLDRAIDRSRSARTISVSPTTTGGGGPQLAPPVEGRGQGLRGDAPALSFARRVPTGDGSTPAVIVEDDSSEPVKRRF